jgi:hypothetical protein
MTDPRRSNHDCQTDGCNGNARWWIASDKSDNPERRRHVCVKCRDELVGYWGWFLAQGWN